MFNSISRYLKATNPIRAAERSHCSLAIAGIIKPRRVNYLSVSLTLETQGDLRSTSMSKSVLLCNSTSTEN